VLALGPKRGRAAGAGQPGRIGVAGRRLGRRAEALDHLRATLRRAGEVLVDHALGVVGDERAAREHGAGPRVDNEVVALVELGHEQHAIGRARAAGLQERSLHDALHGGEQAAREDVVAGLGAALAGRERHAGRERGGGLGERLGRAERVGARQSAGAARSLAGVAEHAAATGDGDDEPAAGDSPHARDDLLEVHDVRAGAGQRVVARDGERLDVGNREAERGAVVGDPGARDVDGRASRRGAEVALGVEDRSRRAEAVVPRHARAGTCPAHERGDSIALCRGRRGDRLRARVERVGARRDPVDALRRERDRDEHEDEQHGACRRREHLEPHGTSP
jgi:hypothetical protein